MTDYFYQAKARNDPPEDEGETPFADADPRRNVYPPEDEAYWAEAGASAPAEEPLWYEDRVGLAEAGQAKAEVAPLPRESLRRPPPRWAAPESPLASDDEPSDAEPYFQADTDAEAETTDWRDSETAETTAWAAEPQEPDRLERGTRLRGGRGASLRCRRLGRCGCGGGRIGRAPHPLRPDPGTRRGFLRPRGAA